jgi:hypothetical protein
MVVRAWAMHCLLRDHPFPSGREAGFWSEPLRPAKAMIARFRVRRKQRTAIGGRPRSVRASSYSSADHQQTRGEAGLGLAQQTLAAR